MSLTQKRSEEPPDTEEPVTTPRWSPITLRAWIIGLLLIPC